MFYLSPLPKGIPCGLAVHHVFTDLLRHRRHFLHPTCWVRSTIASTNEFSEVSARKYYLLLFHCEKKKKYTKENVLCFKITH